MRFRAENVHLMQDFFTGDTAAKTSTVEVRMAMAVGYEAPFIDLTPHGPDGLFKPNEMDELILALDAVRASAIAA